MVGVVPDVQSSLLTAGPMTTAFVSSVSPRRCLRVSLANAPSGTVAAVPCSLLSCDVVISGETVDRTEAAADSRIDSLHHVLMS